MSDTEQDNIPEQVEDEEQQDEQQDEMENENGEEQKEGQSLIGTPAKRFKILNLNKTTTLDTVKQVFGKFGEIKYTSVVHCITEEGIEKWEAIVEIYSTDKAALTSKVIKELHESVIDGSKIEVLALKGRGPLKPGAYRRKFPYPPPKPPSKPTTPPASKPAPKPTSKPTTPSPRGGRSPSARRGRGRAGRSPASHAPYAPPSYDYSGYAEYNPYPVYYPPPGAQYPPDQGAPAHGAPPARGGRRGGRRGRGRGRGQY